MFKLWFLLRDTVPLFTRLGVEPGEVGIISPYRKQTVKLRQMMAAMNMDYTNIRIGSVEEFQVGTF